jgi:hypothetical protein
MIVDSLWSTGNILPATLLYFIFQVVEKLSQVTSNFGSEPTTPGKQWEEFQAWTKYLERHKL